MTTLYLIIGGVVIILCALWFVRKDAKKTGADEQKIKYQEAEIELREKMADIDAAPDVDDPLSML
jgi:hypothetical protein